jgi:hypothetical protein
MMCTRILTVLLIFAFVQIQLRWKRDEVVTQSPWLLLWKGKTTGLTQNTGTDFQFEAFSRKYGTPLISYDEIKNTFTPKERTEVEIHAVVKLNGPPLSFHRVVILVNDQPLRTLDMFIPNTGEANNDMMARFALAEKTKIRIHHYYDSVWNKVDSSNGTMTISFRSGIPNLYDTPWVYK